MGNSFKTGVLLAILVAPVLVFLFLKNFGSNTYSLEVFNTKRTDCLSGSVESHIVPAFSLISQKEDEKKSDLLVNKIYLASFIHAEKKNTGKLFSEILRVNEAFKSRFELTTVFHIPADSIDNQQLLNKIKSDLSKINVLVSETGLKDIAQLAYCGYAVTENKSINSLQNIDFTDKLVLVDQKRRIRGYYDSSDMEDIDRLILELEILIREETN